MYFQVVTMKICKVTEPSSIDMVLHLVILLVTDGQTTLLGDRGRLARGVGILKKEELAVAQLTLVLCPSKFIR